MVLNTVILLLPAGQNNALAAGGLAILCAAINLPCIWAWLGDALRQHLLIPKILKLFNSTMASLMAITAVFLLHGELALIT